MEHDAACSMLCSQHHSGAKLKLELELVLCVVPSCVGGAIRRRVGSSCLRAKVMMRGCVWGGAVPTPRSFLRGLFSRAPEPPRGKSRG
jgi:hypothetical protein